MTQRQRQKTVYLPNYLKSEVATNLYERLRDGIPWANGVRSKRGFTRKAFSVNNSQDLDADVEYFLHAIVRDLVEQKAIPDVELSGIYLNYYRNGNDYTPSHSHPHLQLIVSLGVTRTLTVGARDYLMGNGDVIVFGSSVHSVPKEPHITEGRISIALFLTRV